MAVICERWDMDIPLRTAGWFAEWAVRSPRQVSRHLTAGYCAYRSLSLAWPGPGMLRSAQEYFGGLGAQSLMIRHLFRPERHTVLDSSPGAVAHLKTVTADWALVVQADSYAPASHAEADLAGLDFGDLTAWRLRPGQPHRTLLDRVLSTRPRAVVLTDIAGPHLHLHRERYASVLSTPCPDYPAYLEALADWFLRVYDYELVRGYYHRWSAVLAFVPGGVYPRQGFLQPTPDHPVGLELP